MDITSTKQLSTNQVHALYESLLSALSSFFKREDDKKQYIA